MRTLHRPEVVVKDNQCQLEFTNGSRIVALPGREETIRSFQGVTLLILDEAARIPDELYSSVSPMTGVSGGRTICLSTPFGQRGFFWREWHNETVAWTRYRIPWQHCPRLTPAFIDNERRKFGETWIRQEYECSFEACEGLVYPDFGECLTEMPAAGLQGTRVGGIDFGFRNPFAAVWGALRDDVLWLERELYARSTPLSQLLDRLPRNVTWYADPAGAADIEELRLAGFTVRRGRNDIRAGIAAVTARVQTGRLRVDRLGCPNLVNEAKLYRYPSASERGVRGENPVDENNHALAALRYLVSRIDARMLAKYRRAEPEPRPAEVAQAAPRPAAVKFTDHALWTTL